MTRFSSASEHYSLWLLTVAPTIWATHLLLCYIMAAVWCAKFVGSGGALGGVRSAIAWYTVGKDSDGIAMEQKRRRTTSTPPKIDTGLLASPRCCWLA